MSQHDFSISNQGFPSFRSDLNDALGSLASNSSGSTAPSTTYAYQFWYDTANDLLKMRNGDNDAWITLAAFDQANDEWEVRSSVIQAVDAGGVEIKTDDGTTRLEIADDGTVTIPGDFVVQGTVTGIDTDKIFEGNSSVEVVDTGTGHVAITTDGSERVRVDSSGNVGIGTSSPSELLNLSAGEPVLRFTDSDNNYHHLFCSSDDFYISADRNNTGSGNLIFRNGGTSERMRIDSSGNLKFDSGYGSVATAYGCRAWVNFDGTGTVSIRDSGNVSSITDNGTGHYTVNFTNAMPDNDFVSVGKSLNQNAGAGGLDADEEYFSIPTSFQTSGFQIFLRTAVSSGAFTVDSAQNVYAVFR